MINVKFRNILKIGLIKNVAIVIPLMILILMVILSIPSPLRGYAISKSVVDSVTPISGYSGLVENSIAVSSDNLAHVVYYDPGEKALKYSKQVCIQQPCNWDCAQTCPWSTTLPINLITHITTDSTPSPHYPSVAVDSKNTVHVIYTDHSSNQLNYAKLENGIWTISKITDLCPCYDGTIKLDSKGIPHIVYVHIDSNTNWEITHLKKSGNAWTSESVIAFNFIYHISDVSFGIDSRDDPQVIFAISDASVPTGMDYAYKKYGDVISISNNAISASGNDGNVPSNVLDNNFGTRWSNQGVGSWIRADLGSSNHVCSVSLAWYKGNERKYNYIISTSSDGVTFSNKLNGQSSGKTLDTETYTIPSTNARYVKVTVNGNTDPNLGNWASITELDIAGSSPDCPYWESEDPILNVPNQPKRQLDPIKEVHPSIAVDSKDSSNTPHIVFIYLRDDPVFGDALVHAIRVKSFVWNAEVVDSWSKLANPSIAVESNRYHFAYLWWWDNCYTCTAGNGAYANTNYSTPPGSGSDNDLEGMGFVVNGPVGDPQLAVDKDGFTHISYVFNGNTIKYASILG
jgi:hypothetical protein